MEGEEKLVALEQSTTREPGDTQPHQPDHKCIDSSLVPCYDGDDDDDEDDDDDDDDDDGDDDDDVEKIVWLCGLMLMGY